MASDSETESEPESFQFQGFSSACDDASVVGDDHERNGGGTAENAKAAIETLRNMDIHGIRRDQGLHDRILCASNTIIAFLKNAISSSENKEDLYASLGVFTELVQVPFISLLFDYRKVFHSIATDAILPGTAVSTVVCWVDVILSTLGETVVEIARGIKTPRDNSVDLVSETVRRQSDDNHLRAAAQLPLKWNAVPNVISSERASPAAKRLALRLTFAVYIMSPQLSGYDTWPEDGILPLEMLKIVQSRIMQSSYPNFIEASRSVDLLQQQERINDAMMISLFATSDTIFQRTQALSPFRPQSVTSLLRIIQQIIRPEGSLSSLHLVSPCEDLDTAQAILLGWGSVLPWCWMTWKDERIANAECITHLTATWLFHFANLLSSSQHNPPDDWIESLMQELAKHPAAARSAIIQLLHHAINALCSIHGSFPPPLVNVLYKCCWASVRLLDLALMAGGKEENRAIDLCIRLSSLFVILGNSDEELQAKCYIMEALTFVTPAEFQLAIDAIQADTNVRFAFRLDEVISRASEFMLSDLGGFNSKSENLLLAKHVLDFLTILLRKGGRDTFPRQTISKFLSSVIDCLSKEGPDSMPSVILCDTVLTTLAALEMIISDSSLSTINRLWDDETVWQVAMSNSRPDLLVASGFSQYIVATGRSCSPLCCAEAWDYLRDMLLLILSGTFVADDEPLSLLVCPSICHGLLRLLQLMDTHTAQFILSSPWTTTLCTDLQIVLDKGTESEDGGILKARLDIAGGALVHHIKRKLHPGVYDHALPLPRWDLDLLFCHLEPHPKLVLVPNVAAAEVQNTM